MRMLLAAVLCRCGWNTWVLVLGQICHTFIVEQRARHLTRSRGVRGWWSRWWYQIHHSLWRSHLVAVQKPLVASGSRTVQDYFRRAICLNTFLGGYLCLGLTTYLDLIRRVCLTLQWLSHNLFRLTWLVHAVRNNHFFFFRIQAVDVVANVDQDGYEDHHKGLCDGFRCCKHPESCQ